MAALSGTGIDHGRLGAIATGAAVLIGISPALMVLGKGALQGVALIALSTILLIDGRRIGATLKGRVGSPLALVLASVFMLGLPGVLGSGDVLRSFDAWGRTFAFALGAGAMWAFLSAERARVDVCLKSLLIGTAAAAVLALIVLNGGERVFLAWWRATIAPDTIQVFGQLKAFANIAMCLIPILLLAGWRLKGRWFALAVAVAVLAAVVIVQTRSAAAFAGLGGMVLVVGGLVVWRKRTFLPAYAATLAALAGGTFHLLSTRSTVMTLPSPGLLPDWLVDGHRQYIWKFTIEKILESPWIGYGPNTVSRIPGANDPIPGIGHEYIPSHPHNIYLELLAELGVIGTIPLLIGVALVTWWTLGGYLRRGSLANLALFALMAGFWGSSMFNFSFWSAWWQVSFLVMFAIARATEAAAPSAGAPPS